MHYSIQSAAEKDLLRIFHFVCELEETIFNFAEFKDVFSRNINNPNYYYLVAITESDIAVGFISCHTQSLLHHCGRVAEIQEFFVDSDFRSMGIGQRLICAVEKRLRTDGFAIVEVTAQYKRVATHRFYELNGFDYTHRKFVKALS